MIGAPELILALDQGTTSTRALLFDHDGRIVAAAQKEHAQHFPHPGWVEHDAAEIWSNTRQVIDEALAQAPEAGIRAIGITN
ncbi:MAG TPA: FGGY family carbohydrate kinase, partial [Terrimesophilobacter sp.]|nr:FGGY family carbohydrate kinase [Terrimesophilobacter sp.]